MKLNISGIQLFCLLWWLIIVSYISSYYIWWNMSIFLFCVLLIVLILLVFIREWIYYKNAIKFDELLLKSTDIEKTLFTLSIDKKYKKYVDEYNKNKEYIIENDKELIILNKSFINKGSYLIKICKDEIDYNINLFHNNIKIDNIDYIFIDECNVPNYWYIKWFSIKVKEIVWGNINKIISVMNWNNFFVAWEDWSNLPIRRKILLFRIKSFFKKHNININVTY